MPANIRWFIAFRVFFNARFYYPVLGVLFLDLGLSAAQYSMLNVIWAVSIVLFEVPSGAVADLIGRRRLVVIAAGLMVVEMAVFAFAPAGVPWLLFAMMALNRFLSGLAEAAASGADEALAYDSIPTEQRETLWPRVLRWLGAWQSAGFVAAMILGGLIYDPATWEFIEHASGFVLPSDVRVRLPVYLTLLSALLAWFAAGRLREDGKSVQASVGETYRAMIRAGSWILRTTPVLLLIVAGLLNDSVVRLFLTFNSNYYRLLGVPEAWFGVLGALFAAFGFIIPAIAGWMVGRFSAVLNFCFLFAVTLAGLIGVAVARDWFGILFASVLGMAMFFLGFFVSTYLNRLIDSERRATVLSFRGLAFNLSYAAVGIGFSQALALIRRGDPGASEEEIFGQALAQLPVWFAGGAIALGLLALARRGAGVLSGSRK